MRSTVPIDQLKIDKALYDFVTDEALPGSGVAPLKFWHGFAAMVRSLAPRNAALLRRRDELQSKIDAWHRTNPGVGFDRPKYKAFLREIGYLVAEKEPFSVSTATSTRKSPISRARNWWCRSATPAMR
jgi:malate synthase